MSNTLTLEKPESIFHFHNIIAQLKAHCANVTSRPSRFTKCLTDINWAKLEVEKQLPLAKTKKSKTPAQSPARSREPSKSPSRSKEPISEESKSIIATFAAIPMSDSEEKQLNKDVKEQNDALKEIRQALFKLANNNTRNAISDLKHESKSGHITSGLLVPIPLILDKIQEKEYKPKIAQIYELEASLRRPITPTTDIDDYITSINDAYRCLASQGLTYNAFTKVSAMIQSFDPLAREKYISVINNYQRLHPTSAESDYDYFIIELQEFASSIYADTPLKQLHSSSSSHSTGSAAASISTQELIKQAVAEAFKAHREAERKERKPQNKKKEPTFNGVKGSCKNFCDTHGFNHSHESATCKNPKAGHNANAKTPQ